MAKIITTLLLPDEDRVTLETWTRSPKVSAGAVLRARIVLASADGEGTSPLARRLGISRPTVIAWRERYRAAGIAALADAPRSGRPKVVDEAEILARTLEAPPPSLGVTHWSTRLLASELGIGDATVARCWRRYALQPWRRETFKFSTDPELEAKVRGVVGLYLDPPEKAVVLFRGREEPDPGSRSHRTHPTHSARATGESHPRLRAPWHHHPLCRS